MDLKNLTIEELEDVMESFGEKKFRAKQIFKWIFSGAEDFSEMTNISKSLREKLSSSGFFISNLEIMKVQESSDGTKKFLFGLSDGNSIESVFMRYRYGNSICVSSQAGCRMGCRFCASGIAGLERNLTAGEIADQIISAERYTGEKIGHVVVMGTGEPFDNYENLKKFIRLINSSEGMNIGLRNITVSTCGIIPKIREFAGDFPQVNLAISLHASSSDARSRLMPVNDSYPMEQLIAAAKEHGEITGRRVTYEYTLVKGSNDSVKDADRLSGLLRGSLCHVNLIPLNEVKETGLSGTTREDAVMFMKRLEKNGVPATVRRELGSDIDAACGQLRLNG